MSAGRHLVRLRLALGLLCLGAVPAAAQEGLKVGDRAPAVVVHDLDGRSVDLGEMLGRRPILLEFWATWCSVCEELLPKVKAAHDAFGQEVEFIGVNVTINQTPTRVRRYLESHQPPFRTLYDDEGTSTRAYQVPATSYVVIIDRRGRIVYTGSGAEQDFAPALRLASTR
jgi:peroxiredoxin